MRRLIVALLCSLFSSVASAVPHMAPGASGNPQTMGTGAIQIGPVKELRKGVDLWPLIVNPDNPAELRVNATLTQLNRRLAQALNDCDAEALNQSKQMSDTTKDRDSASGDWSREVQVTMAGPRFLSLIESEDWFCGGAYPDEEEMSLVFDMTTGAPVNWTEIVAKSAGASSSPYPVTDDNPIETLILPGLQKMNIAAANKNCKNIFREPESFIIWPDAMSDTLVAQPSDLPHVVQACAKKIVLTIEQARKLGFSESLLSAIEQAHRQISVRQKR
jgi:hypothetical protein